MSGKVKKSHKNPLLNPTYSLKRVKELVFGDQFDVDEDALRTARDAFSWERPEIKRFLLGLRGAHFYKTDRAEDPSWQVERFDFYKAQMYGQTVYTHLFIRGDRLVIVNSFKPDESAK